MLYSFFLHLTKMLGVAQPFGFATPTFIIEPKLTAKNLDRSLTAIRFRRH